MKKKIECGKNYMLKITENVCNLFDFIQSEQTMHLLNLSVCKILPSVWHFFTPAVVLLHSIIAMHLKKSFPFILAACVFVLVFFLFVCLFVCYFPLATLVCGGVCFWCHSKNIQTKHRSRSTI